MREEISSRYTYYYVRVDNGLLAPLLGYVLAAAVLRYVQAADPTVLLAHPQGGVWLTPAAAGVVGVLLLAYLPALSKEIDDLETLVVSNLRGREEPNATSRPSPTAGAPQS